MDLSVVAFLILLGLIGITRLAELGISRRHQQQMALRGVKKRSDAGYVWMVVLHAAVLLSAGLEVVFLHRPLVPIFAALMTVLFLLATALRWWVIRSLGAHWNVEVMASAPMGVVQTGPFRWVRHPNYLGVFVELVTLPLIHGAWITALGAAIGNALVLHHRLSIEEPVLDADPVYRKTMSGKPRFLPRLF